MSELAFLSASDIAARIRDKQLGCEEILRHYLDRVDRYNGELNALIVDIRNDALVQARAADRAVARGDALGPLHGVPMTIKESYNLAGTPTTWGHPDWKDNIAGEDAESIKKLKRAGVVIFGKTNVPLMLSDFQSYNAHLRHHQQSLRPQSRPGRVFPAGRPPLWPRALPALKPAPTSAVPSANPAHYCGVFGHKPTWNLLWMRGHSPPGNFRGSPDISVIGPLARSASDLETAVNIMAGPDEIMARGYRLNLPDLGGRTLRDLKVAVWADDERVPVNATVCERVLQVATAFRDGGATVDELARPNFDPGLSHATYGVLLQATMAARMPDQEYESLRQYVANLDPDDDSDAARVFRAQVASFKTWKQNDEQRSKIRWQWHEFFNEYDLVLMPIMLYRRVPTHDHQPMGQRTVTVNGEPRPYFEQVFWAGLASASYLPSTVIPTGLNDQGLPIGVQIIGPEYGDRITIAAAKLMEAAGFDFTTAAGLRNVNQPGHDTRASQNPATIRSCP